MVPAKVLGKFGATPYRWDESGNPACASLDGKTCWKAAPDTCAAKLKALPGLIAGGKLKALVCGDMHKKIWGNTVSALFGGGRERGCGACVKCTG